MAAYVVGRRTVRHSRRHTGIVHPTADTIKAQYLLYLRPFDQDEKAFEMPRDGVHLKHAVAPSHLTEEEELVGTLGRFGRVVALGNPYEGLPLPGAERIYLPNTGWKPVVSDLIRRANLVVLVAGTTESTLWELTEAVRLLPAARLVILLGGRPAEYDAFRREVPDAFSRRTADQPDERHTALQPPTLPAPPPSHEYIQARPPLLWGAIHFPPGQQPQIFRVDLTRLTPLQRRSGTRLRRLETQRQITRLLDEVEARLTELESDPAPNPD